MQLRANLDETVFVSGEDFSWTASPTAGVERMMLDRDGDEVAVATTIVRFAPDSSFAAHEHPLGEELLVLDGVFSDEHGDFAAGSYLRNPPGTAHAPRSEPGCTLFVKLRQFDLGDDTPVAVQTGNCGPGTTELYRYRDEVVSFARVPAGERYVFAASYHARELLVLAGEIAWQQAETYELGTWSWIRMAPGRPLRVEATTDCVLFSKTRPVYHARAA